MLFDPCDVRLTSPTRHAGWRATGGGFRPRLCSLRPIERWQAGSAIEIDPNLAAEAQRNLVHYWPQVTVVAADGFAYRPDAPADAIVVNAGVTNLSLAWLDALAPENGRLLVPMTSANWTGGFLLITPQRRRDTPLSRAIRDGNGDHPLRWWS